jgi:hypothetical protein
MKPIYLFTGLLAWTSLVVTSCSTPQMAQSVNIQDDVYNTTATAVAYERPAPSAAARYQDSISTNNYGSSDPNYDMDYYSRINRFYYGSPFRSYYDPFFDPYFDGFYGYNAFSPYYSGLSFGLGFNYGWGGGFWGPYSYGGLYSPFWGYRTWPYGGYMGGGYYGGGFLGGGYYGGGYLVGNGRVSAGGRPTRGSENGIGYRNGGSRINNAAGSRGNTGGGVVLGGRSAGAGSYNPNRGAAIGARPGRDNQVGAPTRSQRPTSQRPTSQRPTRTEGYTPQRSSRPTYTPPANNGGSRSSGGSMGGGGGSSRPARAGGRG